MKAFANLGRGHARAPALALLAGYLLALSIIAALPHLWNLDLVRRIAAKSEIATRYEADARNLKASQQRLAALSNPQIASGMLLGGSSTGLNGAGLQRRVSELATRSGINPQSLRIADPEKSQHGLRIIRLEIGMRASLEQLQDFLFQIETRRPLLFVENLAIANSTAVGSPPEGAPLDVALTIRGLALDSSSGERGPHLDHHERRFGDGRPRDERRTE